MNTRWTLLFCTALFVGCASTPPAPPPVDGLFRDAQFQAPAQPVDTSQLFVLNAAMQRFLDTEVAPKVRARGPHKALVDMLYARGELKLEYDATTTRTAAQAFEARAGNCLSLVIMTAAFAKALDVPVAFQSVRIDDVWSRSGNLYLLSGHVNLTLGHRPSDIRTARSIHRELTIDFVPPEDLRRARTSHLNERTIVAMYLNNRAAESLVSGQLDEAYWWAREAVKQDPRFISAYNTLGVVYTRAGHAEAAVDVLEQALAIEPRNTRVLYNLARLQRQVGQTERAQELLRRLAALEPVPPFHYFEQGQAAMRNGDYRAARDWFAKEVKRADYYHEFHFWLALANFHLGELAQARKHMTLAVESSTSSDDQQRYSAKLNQLRATRQR